jgi:hypothetical protein
MMAWRSIDWGGKLGVAASATSTGGYQDSFSGASEIVNNLAGCFVNDDRSNRRLQGNVFASRSVTLAAFSVPPASGSMFWVIAEMKQGVHAFGRFDINRPAIATIAARRPASRHELLAAKRRHAIAAVSAFDTYFRAVNKHR